MAEEVVNNSNNNITPVLWIIIEGAHLVVEIMTEEVGEGEIPTWEEVGGIFVMLDNISNIINERGGTKKKKHLKTLYPLQWNMDWDPIGIIINSNNRSVLDTMTILGTMMINIRTKITTTTMIHGKDGVEGEDAVLEEDGVEEEEGVAVDVVIVGPKVMSKIVVIMKAKKALVPLKKQLLYQNHHSFSNHLDEALVVEDFIVADVVEEAGVEEELDVLKCWKL